MKFNEYKGKTIIAWHYYNENFNSEDSFYGNPQNTRCYVYPRLLKQENGTYINIDANDFPTIGRIEVKIRGQLTADELFNQVGELVEVQLNIAPEENTHANNWYSMQYNQRFSKGDSEIWIGKFSGKDFIQIIQTYSSIETINSTRGIDLKNIGAIYTNEIIVESQGKFYGPFDYDIKDGKISLSSKKENQYYIAEYLEQDFSEALFAIKDNENDIAIEFVEKDALIAPYEMDNYVDWIDDAKLLEILTTILKSNNNYTKEQIRQIRETLVETIQIGTDIVNTDFRINRIKQLLGNVEYIDSHIRDIAYYVMEDKELGNTLTQIICTEHFNYIEENSKDFIEVRESIEKLNNKKKELELKIEELREDKTVITEEEKKKQGKSMEKIQTDIDNLIARKNELMEEVENIDDIHSLIVKKDKLENDAEQARKEYEQRVYDQRKLKEELDRTLSDFKDQAKIIARELDRKLLDEVLNDTNNQLLDQSRGFFDDTLLSNNQHSDKAIVTRISTLIRDKANRIISDNDIVNYLICIAQGFITTFAGDPGTGKTSLCNLLAKSLGLARLDENRRFIEISVERGWTSHKDFIGYYNPLTKKMEKSNAEVYNAFEVLDSEFGKEVVAPFVFLLDEANLSPIEHYWASFLRNCDFDTSQERKISLGGSEGWKLPNHLRFLATVNFDHTTEELSPRFLDRSWIIMLSPTLIDDEMFNNDIIDNELDIIPFNDLIDNFGVAEGDIIDDVILNKWNIIKAIFRNNGLQIMPRNQKMVYNYCLAACRCMDRKTPETRFAPLDYAIAQKILPTINGIGSNYKSLIEQLKNECNSLPICYGHLERMEKSAVENMGFYQFFTR